jgi:arsenic resistance protein ArsH
MRIALCFHAVFLRITHELLRFNICSAGVPGRTDYLTDRYSERNERARKAIDRQIGKL